MKKLLSLLLIFAVLVAIHDVAQAAKKSSIQNATIVPFTDVNVPPVQANLKGVNKISSSPGVSITGGELNTFYDYQTNGGDDRRLFVTPDGKVHAIYMGSSEKATPGGQTRGSYYCISEDNGLTFRNLGRVESLRAGFPSADLTSDGRLVVASHIAPAGLALGVGLFFDAVAGFGIFTQLDAPRAPIECIWPRVAVPSDDNFVFWGSSGANAGNTWNRVNPSTFQFGFPQNQMAFGKDGYITGEIRGTIARSQGGKVAFVLINSLDNNNELGDNNLILQESVDRGMTFKEPVVFTKNSNDTSLDVIPGLWLDVTALYVGEDLHVIWSQVEDVDPAGAGISFFYTSLRLLHWCPTVNGGVPTTAVRWDSVHFAGNLGGGGSGVNHLRIGYPSLGVDENGILTVAFTAFSGDSSMLDPITNIAYGDIWAASSADNGLQWGEPVNLTNTPDMDERYPYISPWNEAGKINVMFMSDSVAGNFIGVGADGAPATTPDFRFLKTNTPSTEPYDFYSAVGGEGTTLPVDFALSQNYPNPFNPSTTIDFALPNSNNVRLSVYNMRGQLVSTLLNTKLAAGKHSAVWHANDLPSGVYFYKLEAGTFSQMKKMILVK